MGSCISKCKPKKTPKKQQDEECKCQCIDKAKNAPNLVQDKLVISQAPISTPTTSKESLIAPLSPSNSSSYTNSNYPTTSSSSSSFLSSASSSSSILSSKLDRSFSNDFLWSCVKENPHLIRGDYPIINVANSSKTRSSLTTTRRSHASGYKPNGPKKQLLSPQRVVRPAAQKRPRCSSPTPSNLTRQKSFRREPDRPIWSSSSNSSRDLRPKSPSHSRRFNGESNGQSMRRENCNVRPLSLSPSNNVRSRAYGRSNNLLVKSDNDGIGIGIKQVGSKIQELAIGNLLSGQHMDLMPIEDVDNPHIALDCFIFL